MVKELPVIVGGNKRDITGFLANLPGFTGGTTFNPRANGANVGDTEVFVDGGRGGQMISARLARRERPVARAGRRVQRRLERLQRRVRRLRHLVQQRHDQVGHQQVLGQPVRPLRHRCPERPHRSSRRRRRNTSSMKAASRWAARSCCRATTATTRRSSSAASGIFYSRVGSSRQPDHGADRSVQGRRLQRPASMPRAGRFRSSIR